MSAFVETHYSHGITPLGLLVALVAVAVLFALASLIVLLYGGRKE